MSKKLNEFAMGFAVVCVAVILASAAIIVAAIATDIVSQVVRG